MLYIEDDGLLTSAGTVAGIDCCLHLVRQRLGAQTTNHLARRLVVAPHRQGGQAQFIEQPLPDSAQDAVSASAGGLRRTSTRRTAWTAWHSGC